MIIPWLLLSSLAPRIHLQMEENGKEGKSEPVTALVEWENTSTIPLGWKVKEMVRFVFNKK